MIARRTLFSGAATLLAASTVLGGVALKAQEFEEIPLWPGKPPGKGNVSGPELTGSKGAGFGAVSKVSNPRLPVYRPNPPNRRAVLVIHRGRIQSAFKAPYDQEKVVSLSLLNI